MTARVRPPRFSIVTSVHNPPTEALRQCIESVLEQTSEDWEWCLADDSSTTSETHGLLADLQLRDNVRIHFGAETSGIAAAWRDAAALATGEFIVLLDSDDLLAPNALEEISRPIEKFNDVDYLYTDEDKVAADGTFYDRFDKPSWSPERLRGQNYCSHLSVIRRSTFDEVGGLRDGFDGSQDYDLILRVTERARRIEHVDKVLYHWRAVAGSTAEDFNANPDAFDAAIRALDEHLERVGISGHTERLDTGYYRVRRRLRNRPLVSIIIPTRGDEKRIWGSETTLVSNVVRSIVERSTYDRFEIVVVHDVSMPHRTLVELRDLLGDRLVSIPYAKPFDFADKINRGAIASHGDVLILLNDDTEVITDDWIEVLIGHLEEVDVGMVGPMLLLSDGRIQSAGHHNVPTPLNLANGVGRDASGPFGLLSIAGERTGITAACAAIRRSVFFDVGGMSPEFPHSFNDVDLGFKLLLKSMRLIWTPHAQLYHFESLSRDPTARAFEVQRLYERWGWMMTPDPFVRRFDAWWSGIDAPDLDVDDPEGGDRFDWFLADRATGNPRFEETEPGDDHHAHPPTNIDRRRRPPTQALET